MNATRIMAIAISMLMLAIPVFGKETSPDEILKQVAATYKTMKTYKSEGTITSDIDTDVMKIKQVTSFSILLKKPNLYLISWNQTGGVMVQSGNVWSDGTQPYLHMGSINAYSKMTSDEIALSGATGISGGAAFTIPSLFLPVFQGQLTPFSRLKDLQIENTETVEGEDCYVISGSSAISKKEILWISKESHLIRKYSRSLETPGGDAAIPEMTDEQLEAGIKSLGQEVTEETKKNMREMMEKSRSMIKTMKMKGTSTELHATVSSPELNETDFQFSPPAGAVLKESLFGGTLGGNRE